jgi:hypothetical protein
MRATFITTALENGAQLERRAESGGHRDPNTTKLYDRRGYNPEKAASFFATYWMSEETAGTRTQTMKNKDIEEYYFEMFRRDYSLPDGTVEYGDKPDVILRGAKNFSCQ